MHQCLCIEEILAIIFAELDGHVMDPRIHSPERILYRHPESLKTLAGLARTCRAFSESALDVLWREIPDLYVLVKHLLPAQRLSYDEVECKLSVLPAASPEDATWERLVSYIGRIRAIGIPTPPGVQPHVLDGESVLRPLEAFLRRRNPESRALFPYLRRVIYQPFWLDEGYSSLLLHPGLHTLMLPMYGFSSHWGPNPAAWNAPIDVPTCFNVFERLRPHVLPALRQMHNLHTVWIKAAFLDSDTLLYLSTLPSLTTFAIENGWTWVGYPDRAKSPVKAFASLKHLLVSIAHAQCPTFLAYIAPDLLESITIHWEYLYGDADGSGSVLKSCLEELARIPAPRHVAVILDQSMENTLVERREGESDTTAKLRGLEGSKFYLQHIVQMSHLVTLEIGIDVVFQLDNNFLLRIAQRCPLIETLAVVPLLKTKYWMDWGDVADVDGEEEDEDEEDEDDDDDYDYYDRSGPPLPTLDGLFEFAERCVRLRTLKIAVEGTLPTPWVGDSTRGKNGVCTLELWASALDGKISNDVYIKFFDRAFPSLDDIRVLVPMNPTRGVGDLDDVDSSDAASRWNTVLFDMHRRRV
ncbi:hypothetical protein C8Q73DRAFT_718273 [Cubamyces lactineus]|nr:hypothetical protein C8Q73DRAFT_718273 [Cubamyces lactineus]